MQLIDSPTPGQVECFRDIRRQWQDQLKRGFFYSEGEQVFSRLLQSKVEISAVLLTRDYLEKYHSELLGRDSTVFVAEKSWIEESTLQELNQGVLALARVPDFPPLSQWIEKSFCRIVALNGIDHAVNVGAILRNCAAFDVSAVIVDTDTVHPYCWRAVKASLGGVFHVPVYQVQDFCGTLKTFQNAGFSLIAADPAGTSLLSDLPIAEKSCVILGNEHRGISRSVLSLAPHRVAVPVSTKVDSLNVAVASAIVLYALSSRGTEAS